MQKIIVGACVVAATAAASMHFEIKNEKTPSWGGSLLSKDVPSVGTNEAGERLYEHSARMLAPNGKQWFFDYNAAVKTNTVVLQNAGIAASQVTCSENSLFLTLTDAEVAALNLQEGSLIHGDSRYGCYNTDVDGAGPFYRSVSSVAGDEAGKVVLTTTDVDPLELFSDLNLDLKEFDMEQQDWQALKTSPALASLQSALGTVATGTRNDDDELTSFPDLATEEARLTSSNFVELPLTPASLARFRAAVPAAEVRLAEDQARAEQLARNSRPDNAISSVYAPVAAVDGAVAVAVTGPTISGVYFESDDATVYTAGDALGISLETSGFASGAQVKVRFFTAAGSAFPKTEASFLTSVNLAIDDSLNIPITKVFAGENKIYADVCFYTGSVEDSGMSCATAPQVVDVCSLDDRRCKTNSVFVVNASALFTMSTPTANEILTAGKPVQTKIAFHGPKMEDVTIRLMRWRMLAFSDEEIGKLDTTMRPSYTTTVTFNPTTGVAGSIYPYFVQIKYDCGWFRCKKWNSPFFSIPKDIVATWNYKPSTGAASESKTLLDVDCGDMYGKCTAQTSWVRKAQCNACSKLHVQTKVVCEDCWVNGNVAVGGLRVRLMDRSENRFGMTVLGEYDAHFGIKATLDYATAGENTIASVGYKIADFEFTVAGIAFTVVLKLAVDLGVGYKIQLHGVAKYSASIQQPKFTTIIKYGSSTAASQPTATKQITSSMSFAGEGTLSALITPTLQVTISKLIDASVKLPLFIDLTAKADTAGLVPMSKRPAAAAQFGDCGKDHRLEYLGVAGARKFTAHADMKVFKAWGAKAWGWTIWDGNQFNLLQGCGFTMPANGFRFRASFAGAWTWEVPDDFNTYATTAQFLGLLAEDLETITGAPIGRFVLSAVNQYPDPNAVAGSAIVTAGAGESEIDGASMAAIMPLMTEAEAEKAASTGMLTVSLDSPETARLFTRLSSLLNRNKKDDTEVNASVGVARRVAVVEIGVLEDDTNAPKDPKGRTGTALRNEIEALLGSPASHSKTFLVKDGICAPQSTCTACAKTIGCAYCPTNKRCEATGSKSSCAKSLIAKPANCPASLTSPLDVFDAAPRSVSAGEMMAAEDAWVDKVVFIGCGLAALAAAIAGAMFVVMHKRKQVQEEEKEATAEDVYVALSE